MFDDLNTPLALAAFHRIISEGNKAMDANQLSPSAALEVWNILKSCDKVLGILVELATSMTVPHEVQTLVDQRATARKEKNFAESDRLRNALAGLGWEVKDTPQGQKLRKLGITN